MPTHGGVGGVDSGVFAASWPACRKYRQLTIDRGPSAALTLTTRINATCPGDTITVGTGEPRQPNLGCGPQLTRLQAASRPGRRRS